MTTSLKVAEVFGKQYKDVLKAINNLDCSENFRGRNFALTQIEVQACAVKRKSPVYLMTRDGFTFLAMGFTLPVFPFLLPLDPANQSRRSIDTDSRILPSILRF